MFIAGQDVCCIACFKIMTAQQTFSKVSEANQFFGWNTLRKCSTRMDSVPPEKSRDKQAKHARCSPGTFFNIKAEIGHLGTLFK